MATGGAVAGRQEVRVTMADAAVTAFTATGTTPSPPSLVTPQKKSIMTTSSRQREETNTSSPTRRSSRRSISRSDDGVSSPRMKRPPVLSKDASTPIKRKTIDKGVMVTPEKKASVCRDSPSIAEESILSSPLSKKEGLSLIKKTTTPRTISFEPLIAQTWPHLGGDETKPVHTIILGTHPSVNSLKQGEYYASPTNAFWWIAGDCLGFRRGTGISSATQKPYKLADDLREEYRDSILSYQDQVTCLLRHGFGLWDLIGSCRRKGSLDKDIMDETPNDLEKFAKENPSLKRIVLTNGTTSAKLFKKHFKDWCASGKLRVNDDKNSKSILGNTLSEGEEAGQITVVVAKSVSPAFAGMTYNDKRDFWERHVFLPGLRHFNTDLNK